MNKILLVEDDLILNEGLTYSINKAGYQIDSAKTVQESLNFYKTTQYDLLVLDITLPDGTGFDICERVRQTSTVPIIFLTASDEEVNVVKGLDMGGDDYITKPFKLNEVLSRIKALLRRSQTYQTNETELNSNGIHLDLLHNSASKNENSLELTATEFKLLSFFMSNPNLILTKENILNKLWDNDGDFVDENTLSVYISRLRSKIEDNLNHPKMIQNLRGIGYRWNIVQ